MYAYRGKLLYHSCGMECSRYEHKCGAHSAPHVRIAIGGWEPKADAKAKAMWLGSSTRQADKDEADMEEMEALT